MFNKRIDTRLKKLHDERIRNLIMIACQLGSWDTKSLNDRVRAGLENRETDIECRKKIAQLPF